MSHRNVLPHLQESEIFFYLINEERCVHDKILEFGSRIISVNNIFDVIRTVSIIFSII